MVITLTGANDFARHRELQQLVQAFVAEHGDFGLERLDGDEADVARMREAMASLPFLTPRKMVVLREPGKQKAFAENITAILHEIPETTDVIIVEPKLDKRSIYYKTLKKDTDYRELAELDVPALGRWLAEQAKAAGGNLAATDAKLLIDRVGPNQQLLARELEKLLSYNHRITREAIELLTEPLPQSTVFELLDAAFAGRTARAAELYREQRALKVEPLAILAMLAWQLHVLAVVKAAGSKPVDEIAKTAKLNPFVVRKTQAIARRVTLQQVQGMVRGLLDIDLQSKRTAIDTDEALQLYLLNLANI